MTKQQVLGVTGLCTVLLPFLGIPNVWRLNITILIGFILLALYWRMRKESLSSPAKLQKKDEPVFVENSLVEGKTPTDNQ